MSRFTFTPEEKLIKAKIQLQQESPFFAHLVMNMETTANENIPSMGVNFKGNAVYNPKWIDKLSITEIKGVICHEVMHVALLHLLRLGKKEMMLWNIAADITINFMLLHEGFRLPKEAILPQGHYGEVKIRNKTVYARDEKTGYDHTAERIYEQLLDICNGDGEGEGQGQGQGNDDGNGNGNGTGGTGGIGDLPQGFDQHEYGQNLSPAEEEELRKEWKGKLVDAATAAKARGCLPGSIARLVEELLNPKLNWKSILYQYITKDLLYNFTNRRPGKRSWSTGLYFPSEIKENLNIAVTVDCSGSISKKEYQDFISEVVGIANAFEQVNMDLLFWDTDVRLVEKISRANKQKVLDMQPEAGGGTNISCLKDFYKGKQTPQLMIHLTDGWIESEPSLPWCKHMFVLCEKYSSDEIVKEYGIVAKLED